MRILENSAGKLNSAWYNEQRLKSKLPEVYSDLIATTDETEDFKSRLRMYYYGLSVWPRCECGKKAFDVTGEFCSKECMYKSKSRADKIKKTLTSLSEERKSEILEKRKASSLKRYGVENPGASEESKIKISEKNKIHWLTRTTESPFKSKEVQNKVKKTINRKYGVDCVFSLEKFRNQDKANQTSLLKYGVMYPIQKNLKNLEDLKSENKISEIFNSGGLNALKMHFNYAGGHSAIMRAVRKNSDFMFPEKSMPEHEVYEFIKSLGFNPERSNRSLIKPLELDIYIPEKNLAIEFNGIYWHSSGSKETDKEKSKYHLNKTELCESKGIQLLHIFENEWYEKKEIWKSVIKNKLGCSAKIPARKCKVVELNIKEANEFISETHLQGSCQASKALGLYHEIYGLIEVITLSKPRYSKGYDWELIRMCTKLGFSVQGGASKLLSKVTGSIISYANRRWSFGNVYSKIGLEKISVSAPCYWYVEKGRLWHRSSFMKHKLKNKLKVFDDKMTEVENCYANGLRRIWDCGNIVYARK